MEGHKKRSRAEKEALKLLKKLRKTAEKSEELKKEASNPRPVYGPSRPPSMPSQSISVSDSRPIVIGPEIPDFLKDRLSAENDGSESEMPLEGDMVGPALPEVPEMPSVDRLGRQKNDHEVERILKLLNEEKGFVDPYAVLGISVKDASDAAMKKAYWRCSLLVHPDKCDHPDAPKAFQAVNDAWKEVQSSDGRLAIDKKREDIIIKQQADLEAKKVQRRQEWKHVMNPKINRRTSGVDQSGGREAWMTELPSLRRKPTIAKRVNQTTFSRKAYVDVTDGASDWSRMPHRQKPEVVHSCQLMGETQKTTAPLPMNRKSRPTLLEQHQEGMETKPKKKSKSSTKEKSKSFEYRPFDREKDLEIKKGDADAMLKNIGSLGSRFS